MMTFALCTDFDLARALKIPPPLPRTVQFSPATVDKDLDTASGTLGKRFEMRQAKFFASGQVFLDGVLPVLATVHSPKDEDGEDDALPTITFPGSVREAVLGSSKESFAAATQDGNM